MSGRSSAGIVQEVMKLVSQMAEVKPLRWKRLMGILAYRPHSRKLCYGGEPWLERRADRQTAAGQGLLDFHPLFSRAFRRQRLEERGCFMECLNDSHYSRGFSGLPYFVLDF